MSYLVNKMRFPVYLIQIIPETDGEYDGPMYWNGEYFQSMNGTVKTGLTSNPFKSWGFESLYAAQIMQFMFWKHRGKIVPVDPATGQRVNDNNNYSIQSNKDLDAQ